MDLRRVQLDDDHHVLVGTLPSELLLEDDAFEALWLARPADPPTIHVHGWSGPAPRWKRAFGRDYASQAR